MALVLWALTAGAGFYLLVTSNLARTRPPAPAGVPPAPAGVPPAPAGVPPAPAGVPPAPAGVPPATLAPPMPVAPAVIAAPVGRGAPRAPAASPAEPSSRDPASPRELRRAARARWDPPSLVAARQAPVLPGLRSLLEFAHPACGIIGLAFWLGFALVHNKALGWIAFGLVAVTASLGLTWFTANLPAARQPDPGRAAPHFSGRLLVLHGSAAALTVVLAAVTALVTRG